MEKIFEIYIRTTPEGLWAAITDPATRTRFKFGATVESAPDLYGGWPMILSGLETWIETGTSLTTTGSLLDSPSSPEQENTRTFVYPNSAVGIGGL